MAGASLARGPGLLVAGAVRPYPGESVSGDAWTAQWQGEACRVAVIDGLGHGPAAAAAARAATETLAARPDLSPTDALRACHAALVGTRGASMAVALVDPVARRLTYAGVGNVEAGLCQAGAEHHPISYRGIVGGPLPTIRAFEFALEEEWLVWLHTDGVSARTDLAQLPEFPHSGDDPAALAAAVIERWGRPTDDATVVVICPQPRDGCERPSAH